MSIRVEQVCKSFTGGAAITDVTLDIGDGEFFVLLGPSGSGKTTLLRAIAGLTPIDHGRIDLHGRDVTNVGAREREVGFVFQNYALFQHMTVADNIEFALRARRVRARKRRERRRQLLELVSLEGLDHRYPRQLSGGQQQRVAVARALAHEPRVLLLDEPFGALDAKIREDLRRSIRQVQRTIGISTILVTHDQEEAFTLADRIGVMDRGRLQEVGEPRKLYRQPATRFVATFLGAANLLLGTFERRGIRIGESRLPVSDQGQLRSDGDEATVVVRPEDIELAPAREALRSPAIGTASISELRFVGSTERLKLAMPSTCRLASAVRPGAASIVLDAVRDSSESRNFRVEPGKRVWLGFRNAHVLPTPIGSVRLQASAHGSVEALANAPLIRELCTRLQIEPVTERPADRGIPLRGLPVFGLQGVDSLPVLVDALSCGARQVLALPPISDRIRRMVICADPVAIARNHALSAAATFARHLDVDAAMLLRSSNFPKRTARYKELLDLRSESLRRHGLDVRTRTYTGSLLDAMHAAGVPPQQALLVIGLTPPVRNSRLHRELSDLLAHSPPAGLLLVAAGSRQPAREARTAFAAAR